MLNRKGQSLIEVVLAIAVAVIAITALVFLAVSALRNAQSALARSIAEKLSLGGVEAVRVTRDISGFTDGFSSSSDYYAISEGVLVACAGVLTCNDTTHFDSITLNAKLTFYRKIFVSGIVDGKRDVSVTVTWKEGVGDRTSYLSSTLYDWK